MSCPESSDRPSRLPSSIDVYLPGREVWDDYRMEMLDDRLTELGYPSKINSQINTHSPPNDPLEEQEQDLCQQLDLQKRLQAFLDQNPDSNLQIPLIRGIFPLPTQAQPSNSPRSPALSLSGLPISNSQLKRLPSVDIVQPDLQLVSSTNEKPTLITDSTQDTACPSLKPTAPEFKPGTNLHTPLTATQNNCSTAWESAVIANLPRASISLGLHPVHSSISFQQPLQCNPTLTNAAPDDKLDDADLTDSDQDQTPLQSNPNYDTLGAPATNQQEDQEDNVPLATLQHNLKSIQGSLPRSFMSVNTPGNLESHYDADVDQQSDCTNPSDEEDCLGDQEDNSMMMSNPSQVDSHHQPLSPLSTPHNRAGRSHTFGASSLHNFGASMSAGQGQPHNWINGSENEEGDLISNPSDEEEAELYQLHRPIIKPNYSEITSSIHQTPGGSNFKASTPTSRFLLNSVPSPDHATNLAITVGRATGSVMSLGMLENPSSHVSLTPNQGSTSSLNAFAPEFKPTVIFSSPLISNPCGSKDTDEIRSSGPCHLSSGSEKHSKPPMPICSIGRGGKKPEMSQESEVNKGETRFTNSVEIPSVILFEQPVSSAPFQVPDSFPTLSTVESASAAVPTSPPQKKTVQQVEQPGKDNMRNFKFPVIAHSRMVLYQAHMSESPAPATLAPVLESEQAMNFEASVQSGQEAASWSSTPQAHPSLVVDIPSSPSLAQIDSGLSVSLRQRSSFEDDSGSDLSPSISRPSCYELIPTQPYRGSLHVNKKQEKDDNDNDQKQSSVSTPQLEEQKTPWSQLTSADGNHHVNSYQSGSETDQYTGHPTHSVPLRLDIAVPRRSSGEPPQVVVPPGSPFSPFDGMMESSGSMFSFREDPPILNLPPPTSHLVLTPTASRTLSLKPSCNNLAQNYKIDPCHRSLSHSHDREELDGSPDISLQSRNLNLSPSPSACWLASSEEGNSRGSIMPTHEISKTDVEDETLFSSRILEEKDDEDSSSGGSSSDSSCSVETNSKHHHNGKNLELDHGLMADLERMLTRKLNGLRQDLGELHSLKVDWDSIKRDAIIDEITSLMDNILRSWSEPWKEKIATSVVPDQKADTILDAINQWGGKTENRLIEAIDAWTPNSNLKTLSADSEAIQTIRSELKDVHAQLIENAQGLDLDSMTAKLSDAVKPQIVHLIDLASDKSETANLISKQLHPYFADFQTKLENIFTAMSEQNETRISMDGLGRADFLSQLEERLATLQADSHQKLLQLVEKQTTEAVGREIKKGTEGGFETINRLDNKAETLYQDLSSQVNQVSQELIRKVEAQVQKGISCRRETDDLIDQLRSKNQELELNVAKARSEHGKIRSERAVERERHEEDRNQLVHERDQLKKLVDRLQAEQVVQNREKMVIEVEKDRLAGSVDEMRQLIEQLNTSLSSYKTQESQWQTVKAEQDEKIANLQIKNQISESQIQMIKTEMELKQKFYETREGERENELIRLKEKDLDQSNQIKKLIEDQIPLIKNFDIEIRDLIKLKSESDGEIRTLRKRISDQDEQIGNLHQSSASKQQALAMANQKLSEVERKGKQECEGLRAEVEQLKQELNRTMMESDVEKKLIQDEKIELENEVNRLRAELEMESVKESVICQNLSNELDQSNQRRQELEDELKSFRDVNELLKNQIDDLGRFHERQKGQVGDSSRLMVMGNGNYQFHDDQSVDWKANNTAQQTEFNNPHMHELSLSIKEDGHVHSTIPLTESIHAAGSSSNYQEGWNGHHSSSMHPDNKQGSSSYYSTGRTRRASNSSMGTVKSFKGSQPPQHFQLSGSSAYVPHPTPDGGYLHLNRIASPTPSRISVSSRAVSVDHDGWWSATD